MLYFANPSTQRVRDAMIAGDIGCIATPKQGNLLPPNVTWCADNGCFGKGYPGDDAWLAWLASFTPEERSRCAFAVAPDVVREIEGEIVGDAQATLERSQPWLPVIRDLGYHPALVAQDGLEHLAVPWSTFAVLFIGGGTDWKLGRPARHLVGEAKARGKRVHMGRVNSERRYEYARAIGCDSADGTYLTYGPDVLLPAVLAWTRNRHQTALELT